MSDKNTEKSTLKTLIIVGVILFIAVVLFITTVGSQEDFATAAANARVPWGEVFKGLTSKIF